MRILVVEDEKKIAEFLRKGLAEHGYAVDLASSLAEAIKLAGDNEYDLVTLDVMLPDGEGFGLARYLRENAYRGPILMLTALSTTKDKVKGLDVGADDYLVKPFAFDELLARVRALLRRYSLNPQQSHLRFEDIEMDLVKRTVKRANEEIELTNKEFALLEFFLRNSGRPISRSEIIEHVWDMGFDPGSNVVDVYVNMLRKKLHKPDQRKLLHTIVGQGYALKVKD